MKKILSLFVFLLSFFLLFSQSDGYRGQRKTLDNVDGKIVNISYSSSNKCLDIFFSVPVDPRSLSGNNIFLDNSPIGRNVKITFNKDGTQARVFVNDAPPFTVKVNNVKSYNGKNLPSYSKKIF